MKRNDLMLKFRWKIRFEKNEKYLNVLTPCGNRCLIFDFFL